MQPMHPNNILGLRVSSLNNVFVDPKDNPCYYVCSNLAHRANRVQPYRHLVFECITPDCQFCDAIWNRVISMATVICSKPDDYAAGAQMKAMANAAILAMITRDAGATYDTLPACSPITCVKLKNDYREEDKVEEKPVAPVVERKEGETDEDIAPPSVSPSSRGFVAVTRSPPPVHSPPHSPIYESSPVPKPIPNPTKPVAPMPANHTPHAGGKVMSPRNHSVSVGSFASRQTDEKPEQPPIDGDGDIPSSRSKRRGSKHVPVVRMDSE